jgi:heme/copper-type cytochrome/quinol oxidase subunit 2
MSAFVGKSDMIKIAMVLFVFAQTIRQLVQVNNRRKLDMETNSGQVAEWMTITLTIIIASFLAMNPTTGGLIAGGLTALIVGLFGTGISLVYDSIKHKGGPTKDTVGYEKNRLYFGISYILFAVVLLMFMIYTYMSSSSSLYSS